MERQRMTPYYSDDWLTVWQGDCREVMAQMEPESVHTVVTSPPYWGLRDYGTATWIGGDDGCDHKPMAAPRATHPPSGLTGGKATVDAGTVRAGDCSRCGAVRQDSQLGLEPTPEEYVENIVAVFREVRRVLRADGTCWVNLGDSYNGGGAAGSVAAFAGKQGTHSGGMRIGPPNLAAGLKPKDLVGIPWRVAFALQADGWYLRSDIIWSKPNPMPESVTDRPTKAHEYLFLLSKSPRYYYDADAVREDGAGRADLGRMTSPARLNQGGPWANTEKSESGRNLRTVWSIATQPYPGAHFATFPEKLVEPCVKAGTSERGACPECGAPWRRMVERTPMVLDRSERTHPMGRTRSSGTMLEPPTSTTTGWKTSCKYDRCHAGSGEISVPKRPLPEPVPATVLDPFAGSGTTGRVAQRLGRRAVLIDLSGDYLVQAIRRNAEIPLGLEAV